MEKENKKTTYRSPSQEPLELQLEDSLMLPSNHTGNGIRYDYGEAIEDTWD